VPVTQKTSEKQVMLTLIQCGFVMKIHLWISCVYLKLSDCLNVTIKPVLAFVYNGRTEQKTGGSLW